MKQWPISSSCAASSGRWPIAGASNEPNSHRTTDSSGAHVSGPDHRSTSGALGQQSRALARLLPLVQNPLLRLSGGRQADTAAVQMRRSEVGRSDPLVPHREGEYPVVVLVVSE